MTTIRRAIRALARTPAVSALAIATMGVAIGANTAVFSVVYATVLKRLPFPDPDALVMITSEFPNIRLKDMGLSGPEVVELGRLTRAWSHVGAVRFEAAAIGLEQPRRVGVAAASADVLAALGATPVVGRSLTSEDDREDHGKVALLGYRLWQQMYGSDPDVAGRPIDVDGELRTIVGVMPRGFDLLGSETDVWVPLGLNPAAPGPRADHTFRVVARLAPGVTFAQARADLDAAVERWMTATGELHSPAPRFHPLAVTPLRDVTTRDVRGTMLLLLGAVGFVLVLACANVANLLVARAEDARQQIAIRVALGASRRRLLIDSLAEGVCLSTAGCALGLGVAAGVSRALISSAPMLPRHAEAPMDFAVLSFAIGVSLLSGLTFGLFVLRLAGPRTLAQDFALRLTGRGAGSPQRRRLQSTVVTVQIALALTLVAAAGVLIQSFWRLTAVHPGIRTDDVLTFQLVLPERQFSVDGRIWTAYETLLERLRGLDGVKSAAAMSGRLPQRRANNTTFLIEGVVVSGHEGMPQVEFIQHVTPDCFDTLGIRLLKGRLLTAADTERAEPVVVVNETLARKFWGIQDPIGRRIRPALPGPWLTVVGVVSDVKHAGLAAPVGTEVYVTHRQSRLLLPGWLPVSMHVVVRTSAIRAQDVIRGIPIAVREISPQAVITDVRAMRDVLDASIAVPAFIATLLTAFAALAVLLAAVGVYGVIACGVVRRTGEFGVRLALGASPTAILRLVFGQAALPILLGSGVGVAGAIGSGRLLSSFVFEVRPANPVAIASAAALLSTVALVACWIPARRATRVDPLKALRAL